MTQTIENYLRNAVAALPPQDTSARLRLYREANDLLTSKASDYPPQYHQRIRDRLLETIREIEDELEANGRLSTHASPNYAEPEVSQELDKRPSFEFPSMQALSESFKTTAILVAAAAFLICLSVYALFFSYDFEQSSKSASLEDKQTPITQSDEDSVNQPVLFLADMSDGLAPFGSVSEADMEKINVDLQGETLNVTGPVTLFGKDFIPIDRDKIYFMRVVFRIIGDKPKVNPAFYAGFATYDGEKKLETTKPSHRYFVVNGAISEGMTPDSEGWFWFGGVITGSGERPDAFRSTSEYAKPVLIVNFNKPDAITEIKKIEVFSLG